MAISETEYKRTLLGSRRGMLELDLLLEPFAKEKLLHLPEQQQHRYIRLLGEQDTDLFAWLLKKERPDDAELADTIDQILDFAAEYRR